MNKKREMSSIIDKTFFVFLILFVSGVTSLPLNFILTFLLFGISLVFAYQSSKLEREIKR
jgi:hypothetical protein